MIVSAIIIIMLILAFRYGSKKGLVQILLSFIGYIVILVASLLLAQPLGDKIAMLVLTDTSNDNLGYWICRLLAFWGITLGLALIFRILKRFTNKIFRLPLIAQINAFFGGIVVGGLVYLGVFIALLLFSNWPAPEIQASLQNAPVAQFIMKQTPIISNELIQWWIQK